MSSALTIAGANVVCYLNGKRCGRVTSFRWNSATPRKIIFGLDNGVPAEIAPTTFICTGSMGLLRTHLDGGAEALGLTAHSSQVIREKFFTLTLIDISTDTQLFRADKCCVDTQQWQVIAKGIMEGSVNWYGVQWGNEVAVR